MDAQEFTDELAEPKPVTYGASEEIREVLVDPDKVPELISNAIGTALPGWTGIISSEPPRDPPDDETMRCVSVRVKLGEQRPDGKLVAELVYSDASFPGHQAGDPEWMKKLLGEVFRGG